MSLRGRCVRLAVIATVIGGLAATSGIQSAAAKFAFAPGTLKVSAAGKRVHFALTFSIAITGFRLVFVSGTVRHDVHNGAVGSSVSSRVLQQPGDCDLGGGAPNIFECLASPSGSTTPSVPKGSTITGTISFSSLRLPNRVFAYGYNANKNFGVPLAETPDVSFG